MNLEDMKTEINKICDECISDVSLEIKNTLDDAYKEGFMKGILRGSELSLYELDAEKIDWESIKIFAIFCYVNGIDFSYMTKSTDEKPFVERVISRFKECVEHKDISVREYLKHLEENNTDKK